MEASKGVEIEGVIIPFWAVAVILLCILILGCYCGHMWRRTCEIPAMCAKDRLSSVEEGKEETKSEGRADAKRKVNARTSDDAKRQASAFRGPSPTSTSFLKDLESLRRVLENEKKEEGEMLQLLSSDSFINIPSAVEVDTQSYVLTIISARIKTHTHFCDNTAAISHRVGEGKGYYSIEILTWFQFT